MFYVNNLLNSPTLVKKLFEREIYCLVTVRNNRRNMAIMKTDKDIKRGDIDFQYANNVVLVKWFENCEVTIVSTCNEECNICNKYQQLHVE